MMKNKWRVNGSIWKISDTSTEVEALARGVYKFQVAMTGPYLERIKDEFELPERIYGSEKGFVERVVKTYHNSKDNLGILLNGLKGTGKSLTSKMLCNALGLPIILVDDPYNGAAAAYISELQNDTTIFFDEYEKNFTTKDRNGEQSSDTSILSVMDGALSGNSRKVFLLTSNNPYVDDNMLERPGRIRYFKNYTHLTKDIIIEVVDDKLENKELRGATIKFIAKLQTITMDIVNAVVEEVNIHNEDPEVFKEIFNVKEIDDSYDVFESLEDGKRKLIKYNAKLSPNPLDEEEEGQGMYLIGSTFYVNGKNMGEITKVLGEEGFEVEAMVLDGKGYSKQKKIYLIEKVAGTHYSFHEGILDLVL